MKIRKVKHKGLRRFMEIDDHSGLPAKHLERIRNIISFLQSMGEVGEILAIPAWRAHKLSGKRQETWSLTVSANWRITFRFDEMEEEIYDLDYEDYH